MEGSTPWHIDIDIDGGVFSLGRAAGGGEGGGGGNFRGEGGDEGDKGEKKREGVEK